MPRTTHSRTTVGAFRLFLVATPLVSLMGGCLFGGGGSKSSENQRPEPRYVSTSPAAPIMTIAVDGQIDDWPTTASAVADEHYLYVRFKTDRTVSLQADRETVQVQLDLDADRSTGLVDARGELGVDLAVTFSPPNAEGNPGFGTRVESYTPSGEVVQLPAAALDIIMAPTHASEWFELRVGRHLAPYLSQGVSLPREGLLGTGSMTGRVALFGEGGRLLASAEPFEVGLAPAATGPKRVSTTIPDKSLGSVRLMSYNVENSSPDANPMPFNRILRAADPDIVCVQEWYDQTPETLEAWFNRELPIAGRWRAFTSDGRGVAVVTRLDATPFGPSGVVVMPEGKDRTVRSASALVDTAAGPVVVTSVHLKCCGSFGGREDTLRYAEAQGIADMLQSQIGNPASTGVIIVGDYNLVGGTEPLDAITSGLDADGSDLTILEPRGLSEPSMITWTEPTSSFLPGRLDYLAYSDARLSIERSFVFDPDRLDAASLRALNLEDTDASASDHRPIVVDFRPN